MNRLVRSSRLLAFGVLVSAAAALVPAPTAWAGGAPVIITPTTLPAGHSITVSSSNCFGNTPPTVTIGVYPGTTGGTDLPSGAAIVSGSPSPDVSTGAWSIVLTIPTSAAPGTYTVHANCNSDTNNFIYTNLQITVTAPVTTTAPPTTVACPTPTTVAATTTTAAATSTSTTTTLPVVNNSRLARIADPACPTATTAPATGPAAAVPAQPTFTG